MKLEQALKRVGAEVVKTQKRSDGLVLMLRAEKAKSDLWALTIQEFVLSSVDERVSWGTDVSKAFYAHNGVVKYLWRVVLLKDVPGAAEALGQAAIRASSQGVEVKSMPLVGRGKYGNRVAVADENGTATAGMLAANFIPGGS